MKVNDITTVEGHSVVQDCDSCSGSHEVILKTVNDAMKKQGFTHWFECPHNAQGGPVMVKFHGKEFSPPEAA